MERKGKVVEGVVCGAEGKGREGPDSVKGSLLPQLVMMLQLSSRLSQIQPCFPRSRSTRHWISLDVLAVSAGRAHRDRTSSSTLEDDTILHAVPAGPFRHAVVYQKLGVRRDWLRNGVAFRGTLAPKEGTKPPNSNPTSRFHLRPPSLPR